MTGLTVRTKVFLLFAAASLLTLVPVLVLVTRLVEDRVYERAEQELVTDEASFVSEYYDSNEELSQAARRFALEREIQALVRDGDSLGLARAFARGVGKDQVGVAVDSTGRSLVGPALDTSIVNSASTALYVPDDGRDPMRVAVWWVYVDTAAAVSADSVVSEEADSVRVGVVGVARPVDENAVKGWRILTGSDVALMTGSPLRITSSTLPPDSIRFLEAEGGATPGLHLESTARMRYRVIRLATVGSDASLVLLRPVGDELDVAVGIKQAVYGIGVVALALALVLALIVSRIVARPAQALAKAATGLARGDYGAPLPKPSGDEIGQLTSAFREMRSAIAERERRLRSVQAELINREKLAAMGRLVAQLSHEINNPIYNIQNCLEVLDRRINQRDPNREFLALAREELQRMAGLTRQMLDQSRPLADAAQPLDLNQLVQRVMTLAGTQAAAHRIEAKLNLQPNLPLVVAHPDALQQVLANLVENAVDAMPEGGTLTVTTRADAEAVEVLIEDTGVGISEEDLPHIFEAFYTTKPGVSGIGLGLFVSEGIIRGHRGRLVVESRPGEGSRFLVQLPRETMDAALATSQRAPIDEPARV